VTSPPPVVRCAVLGAGAIAQVAHLPILSHAPGVQPAGLHDIQSRKARTIAERLGIPRVYGPAEEIWADDTVDAVVIATPSHLHETQVAEGLRAGKFIFCEKPLAVSSSQAERVLATPGAENRLMVGMNQRFRADTAALRRQIAAGDLGDIRSLRAGWLNHRVGPSRRTWRHRRSGAGGGALMDLGIQMLDLCLWMVGYPTPQRLVAHTQTRAGQEVEDSAFLMLSLEGGLVLDMAVTWDLVSDRDRQYLEVNGSSGSALLPPLRVMRESETGVIDATPTTSPDRENLFTASYREELARFIAAVRGEKELRAPVEHATLLRLIEAAYTSAERGSEVRL